MSPQFGMLYTYKLLSVALDVTFRSALNIWIFCFDIDLILCKCDMQNKISEDTLNTI